MQNPILNGPYQAPSRHWAQDSSARDSGWIRDELERYNALHNDGLPRMALKMATGTGKTVVMAMLIAWQTLNKAPRKLDTRFTNRFLVVTPGITIKDRLRVLFPSDLGNYYRERDLVPADLWPSLNQARITVTNFHTFMLRTRHDGQGLSATPKKLLTARTGTDPFMETEDQMVRRVLRDLGQAGQTMVINDEAHHCYAPRVKQDVAPVLPSLPALGKYSQQILAAAYDRPVSRADIFATVGLADDYRAFVRHINPLVEAGLLKRTVPDKPRAHTQRYAITPAGRTALTRQGRPTREVSPVYDEERPYYVIEPHSTREERAEAWAVGFGLQQVDGLTPSRKAYNLAADHIEGRVTYQQVEDALRQHYETSAEGDDDEREADLSAARISQIIGEPGFTLSAATLKSFHRHIFAGLFEDETWAGQWRTQAVGKPEPVLGGGTVTYTHPRDIVENLDAVFDSEQSKPFLDTSDNAVVERAVRFISAVWKIHPFREGNTRTAAAFVIAYLRSLGVKVDNTPFAERSVYFRDALVLDNAPQPRMRDMVPLLLFARSLTDSSTVLPDLRSQYPR